MDWVARMEEEISVTADLFWFGCVALVWETVLGLGAVHILRHTDLGIF